MSIAQVIHQLKELTDHEKRAVIAEAARLLGEQRLPASAMTREELDRELEAAAEEAKSWYEPGGELTEWRVLDGEDFYDYEGDEKG